MKEEIIDAVRVIPRDLFNEAKLLKCMGRLCLLIEDRKTPCKMSYLESGDPFEVLYWTDGSLSVGNIVILIKGNCYCFYTTYNSQASYSLYVEVIGSNDLCDQYIVFEDNGDFTEQFKAFCKTVRRGSYKVTIKCKV